MNGDVALASMQSCTRGPKPDSIEKCNYFFFAMRKSQIQSIATVSVPYANKASAEEKAKSKLAMLHKSCRKDFQRCREQSTFGTSTEEMHTIVAFT